MTPHGYSRYRYYHIIDKLDNVPGHILFSVRINTHFECAWNDIKFDIKSYLYTTRHTSCMYNSIKIFRCIKYVWRSEFSLIFCFFSYTNKLGIGTGSKRNNMHTLVLRIYIYNTAYLVLDLYVYVPLKPDRTGHCVTTGRWPPVRLSFFTIKIYIL